jgi:antitoxin YefM
MTEVRLSRDVRPLTEFRAKIAECIEQVRASGQPMILTQRGHSAAVVLGLDAYEAMLHELELLRDVRTAEDQVAAGMRQEHERVAVRLRAVLGR